MGVELARKLDTVTCKKPQSFCCDLERERDEMRSNEGEEREMNKSESEERRKRKKIKIKIKIRKGKKKKSACVGRREKEAWCSGFQTFLNIYKNVIILKN